jgi:hypothetical protein
MILAARLGYELPYDLRLCLLNQPLNGEFPACLCGRCGANNEGVVVVGVGGEMR